MSATDLTWSFGSFSNGFSETPSSISRRRQSAEFRQGGIDIKQLDQRLGPLAAFVLWRSNDQWNVGIEFKGGGLGGQSVFPKMQAVVRHRKR